MITALLVALLSLDVAGPVVDPVPDAALQVADYQLGGAFEPDDDVTLVVRDRSDAPAEGRYSLCYVNAFQSQPGELESWQEEHPDLLLTDDGGTLVSDPGWPDEVVLDVSTPARRLELLTVVEPWLARCAHDGHDGVELDNLDAFTRSGGLLTEDDHAAAARLLTAAAHRHGLTVAQKNTAELLGRDLGFDLAVTEECEAYEECGDYLVAFGRAVVEIEYTDDGEEAFARACRERAGAHPISLRDRDVVTPDDPAFVDEHC